MGLALAFNIVKAIGYQVKNYLSCPVLVDYFSTLILDFFLLLFIYRPDNRFSTSRLNYWEIDFV